MPLDHLLVSFFFPPWTQGWSVEIHENLIHSLHIRKFISKQQIPTLDQYWKCACFISILRLLRNAWEKSYNYPDCFYKLMVFGLGWALSTTHWPCPSLVVFFSHSHGHYVKSGSLLSPYSVKSISISLPLEHWSHKGPFFWLLMASLPAPPKAIFTHACLRNFSSSLRKWVFPPPPVKCQHPLPVASGDSFYLFPVYTLSLTSPILILKWQVTLQW